MGEFGLINWIVLLAYFGAMMVLGTKVGKSNTNTESYYVEETGETYVLIVSEVSEDISAYKQDGRNQVVLSVLEADPDYILDGTGVKEELLQEVDFRNLHQVEEKFANNYLRSHSGG